MTVVQRMTRAAAATAAMAMLGACAQTGGLGNILGGVLGTQPMQMTGTIQNVDTRSQQISIQQANGQTIGVMYDNNTRVVYQNQLYSVNSLEYGDQVLARLTENGNTYYTDSIYVTQPVNNTNGGMNNGGVYNGGTTTQNVQSLQGTVRQIDRNAGWFTVNTGNNVDLTVTLPYRANSQDVNRFNNLRIGDYVRFYGVFVNNSRVELRQFY